MTQTGRLLLAIGGVLSALIAVAHLVVAMIGDAGYRYVGAGGLLAMSGQPGAVGPASITLTAAAVFAGAAACGWSGAGLLPRVRVVRPALVIIAAGFLLRGLEVLPQGAAFVMTPSGMPTRYVFFSLLSLVTGLCYALGARTAWTWLGSGGDVADGPLADPRDDPDND